MGKVKVSVTIEESLLEQAARHAGRRSRSEIIESALAAWLRSSRRRALEQDVERYYAELSDDERAEDESWARLGDESLSRGR